MTNPLDDLNLKVIKTADKEIIKRGKKYIQELEKLQKLHKVRSMQIVSFPSRKKVPLLSRISLWILQIQGGVLDTRLEIINKK